MKNTKNTIIFSRSLKNAQPKATKAVQVHTGRSLKSGVNASFAKMCFYFKG